MSQVLPERRSSSAQRWQPLSELDDLTQRMRQMLEQTFGGMSWPSSLLSDSEGWTPLADIEEQDDAYVLAVDLPGVKREDVDIEVMGNELSIRGEVKERERTGTMRRRMRRTGRFEHRVRLPDQIDDEKVEATLDEGVLTVRVPKSERARRRKIEIGSR